MAKQNVTSKVEKNLANDSIPVEKEAPKVGVADERIVGLLEQIDSLGGVAAARKYLMERDRAARATRAAAREEMKFQEQIQKQALAKVIGDVKRLLYDAGVKGRVLIDLGSGKVRVRLPRQPK